MNFVRNTQPFCLASSLSDTGFLNLFLCADSELSHFPCLPHLGSWFGEYKGPECYVYHFYAGFRNCSAYQHILASWFLITVTAIQLHATHGHIYHVLNGLAKSLVSRGPGEGHRGRAPPLTNADLGWSINPLEVENVQPVVHPADYSRI